jgi:hypothetical protein
LGAQGQEKALFKAAIFAATFALLLCADASSGQRSAVARAEFVKANPCPATGKRGPCPGWHVDHIRSLCAGGADHASNMQWLRVDEHKRKTPKDVGRCRAQRAGVATQ